jgi:hypothetical protein
MMRVMDFIGTMQSISGGPAKNDSTRLAGGRLLCVL